MNKQKSTPVFDSKQYQYLSGNLSGNLSSKRGKAVILIVFKQGVMNAAF